MKKFNGKTYLLLLALLSLAQPVIANCGTTDYSGNSGRLYNMVVFVLTCCTAVLYLLYAIAALLSIYSATSIYIKMQAGEEGFTKSIIVLVGSCIFLLIATIVLPAFFGFQFGVTDRLW
ncbi:hypothetical protein BFS16_07980 [Hoylesella timonensis]|uniref:Uncharacterized protein n=1 Tax=Hoylesella timonensis TaxID=386414 RepID=A0A2K0XHT3_9BACT|nr:DUF4134 family protein [Hoylesella timonensis]PNP94103.1 hypothetical protein BFS16_07980 [Hoylesella timonensis]